MYETIKKVLESGRYELSEMLRKIDTIWLQGDITDEQKTELVKLAQDNADPTATTDVWKKLEELDGRMKIVEEKLETEQGEEYPEYISGKWYYKDDKITYKGKRYICIALDGQVCTWNPDEYPAYWKEVAE